MSFAVWRLGDLVQENDYQQQRLEVSRDLSAARAKLESSLNQRLTLVQGLAAFAKTFIHSGRDFSVEEFRRYASELQGGQFGIRSLQLQPDAVVRYVYPLQGNEAIVGHDLRADPDRRDAVNRAIEEKRYVLAGPIRLLQGGTALVGRQPVYQRIDGQEQFWGFAAILLDVEPLYQSAGFFDASMKDVVFALRGVDGLGERGPVFYGSPSIFNQQPVTTSVSLPSGSWQLAAMPVNGWSVGAILRWEYHGIGGLLALALGILVYVLMSAPARLKSEVKRRTRDYQQAVAVLRQEKHLVNALIDNVPDLIYCKDTQGNYLNCNAAFERYIGLTREQLLQHRDTDLFPHDLPAHFHELDAQLVDSGSSQRAEEWVTFTDGRSVLLDTFKVPFVDADGSIVGMIGISRDSTERKWIEQALQASERKYRELIDGLDEALYRVSLRNQQFEFISPSARDVFGYEPDCFTDQPDFLRSIIHPDVAIEFADYWYALCNGEMPLTFQYAIVDGAGKKRWLMQSAKSVCNEKGEVVAVEGICRDITESQRMERNLAQVSHAVAGVVGEDFFEALVNALAGALEMDFAMIALFDEPARSAKTVAIVGDGQMLPSYEYLLDGTPCQQVAGLELCVYAADVQGSFPDDGWLRDQSIESYIGTRLVDSSGSVIGVMALMGREVLCHASMATALLEVFASRVAAELERIANDHQLRKLYCAVDQSPVAVVITDDRGEIEYTNDSFVEMTGYIKDELIGQNPRLLKSGKQSEEFYQQLWGTIAAGDNWHGELQNKHKEGAIYWADSSIYPINVAGEQLNNFVLISMDVTEQKAKDSRLKMASTVFDTTSEAIIVSNSDNKIQMVNPAFTKISGYPADEVIGKDPGLLSSGHHDAQFYADMNTALQTYNHWEGEIWNRRKNGEMYPEWLSIVRVLDQFGDVEQYVAVFSDISRRKETEGLLYQQANYDLLSELPNRMLAQDRLRSALSRAKRLRAEVAVLHIGLDRFKWVNDTYGHDAGDALLKATGQRLESVVGESDTVARLNGDEFLVVLPDIRSSHDAEHIASAIGHRLSKPFQLEKGEAYLTSSIGIALYPIDTEDATALLHHADSAMWRAKESSGASYCFFTHEMNEEASERAQLEKDLRKAIINKEFEVYYQPLISLTTSQVTGAEALIRWQHPEQGLVSPGRFIPLAEETGLIVPIGRWVLEQVCEQVNQWQLDGIEPIRVAVNMSPKQCFGPEGIETIRSVIVNSNVDTNYLVIEITESMLMEDEHSMSALKQLRGLGVKLSMDDFGTGYSSLSYLKHFPIDILKIDRTFIKDLPGDRGDAALVEAIVAMARSLKLEVVAEGVETDEQKAFLKELSCNYVQGFFYSKPMPRIAFEAFVKQYNVPPV
ncbi:MAG: EAL domain-containing protein [Halopseudomonas sp.]